MPVRRVGRRWRWRRRIIETAGQNAETQESNACHHGESQDQPSAAGGMARTVAEALGVHVTVVAGCLGADYRFAANALVGLAASYSNLDPTSDSTPSAPPPSKG